MAVKFGSARMDERKKYSGGKAGDQTGHEVEVITLTSSYLSKRKWIALRAKDVNLANGLAFCMAIACGNDNIGYDQNERLGVINKGILTQTATEADCSTLVRACLKQCGHNVANFTTANEKKVLLATGLFTEVAISKPSDCYLGDILVTATKGHTGIITEGKKRKAPVKTPASAPAPSNNKPSKGITYVVQKGDSLSKIAAKYGTTVDAIARQNKITDVDKIFIGQILKI